MKPFQTITQNSWGGLNEDENPTALDGDELSECLNASPYGKSMGTRPGVNRELTGGDYDDAIVSGAANDYVKGLYHFTKRNDFQRDKLIAVAGDKLWTAHGTSVGMAASADIAVSADNIHTFAQYRGQVFFCNYVENSKSGPAGYSIQYWDGTGNVTGVKIDDLSANAIPDPKYILAKWGHLFVAGMDPAAPDNSNNTMVVRFNDIGSDPTINLSWPTANTIGSGAIVGSVGGLREYGGEFITGLAEFQDNTGDYMLILTSKRLLALRVVSTTGSILLQSSIANGCVHQNAYVNLGLDYGDAVYFSRRGIHSIRQSQEFGGRDDTFLSWKIRRTFDTINQARMPFICGGYDESEGYVLFAVATGSSLVNDTILCLDVQDEERLTAQNARWFIWKLNSDESVVSMATAPDPTGRTRLYVGTSGGSVGYFSRVGYTDFGTNYAVTWTTKHEDYGAPMAEKMCGDMTIDVQPGGSYEPTATTLFDFGSKQGLVHNLSMQSAGALWEDHTSTPETLWDEFDWAFANVVTTRKKFYDSGRGNTIATRFSHTNGNEPFFVAGISREVSGVAETVGVEEDAA